MSNRDFDVPTATSIGKAPRAASIESPVAHNSKGVTKQASPAQLMAIARRGLSTATSPVQCSLLQLQRDFGNHYVQRMSVLARQADGPGETGHEVENTIQSRRGGGIALEHPVRGQMEKAFGADFSGVRVHHDSTANALNHALQARAFTTGQDVFFRQGAYQPGTSGGRELIAHELTHVVQQNGDRVEKKIQTKMTVSQPGDIHEMEADRMAQAVMRQDSELITPDEQRVHRQPESPKDDEEKKKVHRSTDARIARQADATRPDD
jgi:hypothetical protein